MLALITIKRTQKADNDYPAQLIEDNVVMRHLGIPRILDETWVPPNLIPIQAARLHHFIDKVRNKPNGDKADFVHSGPDSVAERKAYKLFFPKISRKINSLVELAMKEHGAHPQDILRTSNTDDFPPPEQLSNLALVQIIITVFGDSVHNGSGILLDPSLHGVAKSWLNVGYVRLRKQWDRARVQIDKKIEEMNKLMKPIKEALEEEEDVRLKDVRMALSACRTVHNMGCWLPGYQLDAEENINLLQSAVDTAVKVPEDATTDAVNSTKPNAEDRVKRARAAGRRLRIAQVDLTDKEEVARTMQEIVSHLETCFAEDDAAPYGLRDVDDELTLSGDLGVEEASRMSYEELEVALGFHDGRPANWNAFVRLDGRSAWQIIDPEDEAENANDTRATEQPATATSPSSGPPSARATEQPATATSPSSAPPLARATRETAASLLAGFQTGGPGFQEQRLLWHQMVGTYAIVGKMWTEENSDTPPGTLLADGVGVGKTAQVMASIAFIQQVYLIERAMKKGNTNLRRPPIIEHAEYFMGGDGSPQCKSVPNYPHLIVVPLSLISQWIAELHRFFRKGSIDIFVLPNTIDAVELFFHGRESAWTKSSHKYMNRIVLCAHPTFTSLTARTFRCGQESGLKSVDEKRPMITNPVPPSTIFDMHWCSTWIDEAHVFRGLSRGFFGSIAMDSRSYVVNCITATPLYTQIRDIFNMARIINIQRFCGPQGQLWEKQLNSRIAKEKRANSKTDKEATSKRTLAAMAGEEIENHAPGIAVRATQYSVIREIQRSFRPHLIRRTMTSKQPDGRPINDKMPSITSHVISITLTDRELDNLNILTKGLEKGGRSVPTDLNLRNFWLVYRTGVIYYKEPEEVWPIFNEYGRSRTRGQYRKFPSTKLDTLARILLHLLSHDDIGHPTQDEDGNFIWPAPPPVPEGEAPPRRRRILVYHEFTMMVSTISSILAYRGVKTHVLNGTLKREERDQVIDDFVNGDDPEKRVLLFSSVGSVGLNLTCADVVIMLDTIWSQVGVEQIIGRSARLTQDKPVHVYYLIALQTTDVLMSTLAQEKGEMLQTLLTKGTNPTLQRILDGEDDDDDIELGVDEVSASKARSAKVSGGGKTKRKPMPATTKSTTTRAAQSPAAPAKRKGKTTAKSSEFVESSSSEESTDEEIAKGKGKGKSSTKRGAQPPAAQEPATPKAKAKATKKRASKEPETNMKKRSQHRAAARDAKKGTSNDDEQSEVDLVPRPVQRSTGSSSDEDVGQQSPPVRASQQATSDHASQGDDEAAMDVDSRIPLTPPPCGQRMRAALPTPTGTQAFTQTTGATQGSLFDDPISDWVATQDLNIRTPHAIDIRDGSIHPPFPPDGNRKHTRSPNEQSPRKDSRPRKRTARSQAESDGEDFTMQMADIRVSSPTPTPFHLATGATSQVDEPVPSLALKPIRSKKKDALRPKPAGSSKKKDALRGKAAGSSRTHGSGSTRRA